MEVCFGEDASNPGDNDYDDDGNEEDESSYCEVGYCRIPSLGRLCMILTMDSNIRAMEDLHPMDDNFPQLRQHLEDFPFTARVV